MQNSQHINTICPCLAFKSHQMQCRDNYHMNLSQWTQEFFTVWHFWKEELKVLPFLVLKKQCSSTLLLLWLFGLDNQRPISHLSPPNNSLGTHTGRHPRNDCGGISTSRGRDFPPAKMEDVIPTVRVLLPSPAPQLKCCWNHDALWRVLWTLGCSESRGCYSVLKRE